MTDKRLKYADTITLDRIGKLHPSIRQNVLEAYLSANYNLLGKGVRLRFAYTYRSNELQDSLYAQGRSVYFDSLGRRLGRVTNAKGGQSIHNYGLAWDIVILLDKNDNGYFEVASWDIDADHDSDSVSDWMEIANYFKSELNATWGGDWTWKDYPHFQIDFGMNWRDMKSKIDNGEYITETIDGTEYKWIKID